MELPQGAAPHVYLLSILKQQTYCIRFYFKNQAKNYERPPRTQRNRNRPKTE